MAAHDVEAQRLRAEGLTYREIGERLGLRESKDAWRACNRDKVAAENKRRRAYKREHENSRRAACPRCDEPMGAGSATPSHAKRMCRSCWDEVEAERVVERDRELERLWANGQSTAAIAAHFGWSVVHLGVEINSARGRGSNLPYRNRSGTKFPHLQKAA